MISNCCEAIEILDDGFTILRHKTDEEGDKTLRRGKSKPTMIEGIAKTLGASRPGPHRWTFLQAGPWTGRADEYFQLS